MYQAREWVLKNNKYRQILYIHTSNEQPATSQYKKSLADSRAQRDYYKLHSCSKVLDMTLTKFTYIFK